MVANNHRFRSINIPSKSEIFLTRYISDSITPADLSVGQQIQINLTPSLPSNLIVLGGYIFTEVPTTSSSPNTTSLIVTVGTASSVSAYLNMTEIFGIQGIKTSTFASSLLGIINISAPVIAELTVSGDISADLTDINQLSLRVILYYIQAD